MGNGLSADRLRALARLVYAGYHHVSSLLKIDRFRACDPYILRPALVEWSLNDLLTRFPLQAVVARRVIPARNVRYLRLFMLLRAFCDVGNDRRLGPLRTIELDR